MIRSPEKCATPTVVLHRVVAKALSQRLTNDIDQLRELELARLNALQASLWPKAEKGELRAVNACVRIIDKRCRLLGLYGYKDAEKLADLLIDQLGNPGNAPSGVPEFRRLMQRARRCIAGSQRRRHDLSVISTIRQVDFGVGLQLIAISTGV
jgi:hypothetical protein